MFGSQCLGGAQKGVSVVKEGGNLVVAVHEIILKCFVYDSNTTFILEILQCRPEFFFLFLNFTVLY